MLSLCYYCCNGKLNGSKAMLINLLPNQSTFINYTFCSHTSFYKWWTSYIMGNIQLQQFLEEKGIHCAPLCMLCAMLCDQLQFSGQLITCIGNEFVQDDVSRWSRCRNSFEVQSSWASIFCSTIEGKNLKLQYANTYL